MFHFESPPGEARLVGAGFAVAARGPDSVSFPAPWDEEVGTVTVTIALNWQQPNGSVRLASCDPEEQPLIDCDFAGVLERGDFEGAWAVVQRLARTDAFRSRGIKDGDSVRPFEEVVSQRIGLSFHLASTCPIGTVLDERLNDRSRSEAGSQGSRTRRRSRSRDRRGTPVHPQHERLLLARRREGCGRR